MDVSNSARVSAIETLRTLLRCGHDLSVKTRTDVYEHKAYGAHKLSYADKLCISGPPVTEELRAAIRSHRDELLAAACVILPPTFWLEVLVTRYRNGHVPLETLAANVASFIGKHSSEDGPALEAIIEEALR
jgi:hypothetical protein